MPKPTRDITQKQYDRARIAQLYLRGYSQYAIAQEMSMTRELVAFDLRVIRKDWKQSAIVDMNEAKHKELHRIDMMEKELWEAWEKSKLTRDITTTRQKRRGLNSQNGDVPVDQTTEAGKRTEQRDPNAAYMDRIGWCIEMRCKILGLYAPAETRHSGVVSQIREISYESQPLKPDGRLVIIGGPQNGHVNGALPSAAIEIETDDEEEEA